MRQTLITYFVLCRFKKAAPNDIPQNNSNDNGLVLSERVHQRFSMKAIMIWNLFSDINGDCIDKITYQTNCTILILSLAQKKAAGMTCR